MTFLSVVILDVDYGLVIGVGISVGSLIVKDQFVQIRNLSEYEKSPEYFDSDFVKLTKSNITDKNVRIFKVQRSIYFSNCENFHEKLLKYYGTCDDDMLNVDVNGPEGKVNPSFSTPNVPMSPINSEDAIQISVQNTYKKPDLILDVSAVNYIDTNGVKSLLQIIEDFKVLNVNVYICGAQGKLLL